jgi:hypothetical protein
MAADPTNAPGPAELRFTRYFLETRKRPDRAAIPADWILRTIQQPLKELKQADGRVRRWALIPEAGNRYLRVVLLPDGTVHNAFFDRDFSHED